MLKKQRGRKQRQQSKWRNVQVNANFPKRTRRDKEFLNKQCKYIEDTNHMGNAGELFKKISEIKEIIMQLCIMQIKK